MISTMPTLRSPRTIALARPRGPDRRDRRARAHPHVQGRDRSGARHRPDRAGRRGVRIPRPERRRQDDDGPDAVHVASPTSGRATRRRLRRRCRRGRSAAAGSASRCRRSDSTRCRPAESCSSSSAGCTGSPAAAGRSAPRSCSSCVGLTDAADRVHEDVLGRDEAPAGSRLGARPQAARCCSSTSRRRGSTRRSRLTIWDEVRRINSERRDRVPDDAVPRGGRQAVRPARDHRRRPDRRRREPPSS